MRSEDRDRHAGSPTSQTLPQPSPPAPSELGPLGGAEGSSHHNGPSQTIVPAQAKAERNSNSKEVPAPGGQKEKGHLQISLAVPTAGVTVHLSHFTGDSCGQPNTHWGPSLPRSLRSDWKREARAVLTLCRNSRATFRSMAGPDRDCAASPHCSLLRVPGCGLPWPAGERAVEAGPGRVEAGRGRGQGCGGGPRGGRRLGS